MRILLAHNYYQQRGGEDVTFEGEAESLNRAGYAVESLTVTNAPINDFSRKVRTALQVINNPQSVAAIVDKVEKFEPDVVHFHNIFPRLSVAAVAQVAKLSIPTIVRVPNYRLLCAKGSLERKGRICEDCLDRSPWPAVVHRCYRKSAVGSLSVVRMARAFATTFANSPDYISLITPAQFVKSKLVEAGYDPSRIFVKPNATHDYGIGRLKRDQRFVFVGRLSREKGANLVMQLAKQIDAKFEVIGVGPEKEALSRIAPSNVTMLGALSHSDVYNRLKTALATIVPSQWYEPFGRIVIESFSTATPVVGSRLGGIAEIIQDGQTGFTVAPDDLDGWKAALKRLLDDPALAQRMGNKARDVYELRYSQARNLDNLIPIYHKAIERSRTGAY